MDGVTIRIPKGFPTDLASIPKIVRSLLDKEDLEVGPAIIHDALYKLKGQSEARFYDPKDDGGPLGIIEPLYKLSLSPKHAKVTRRAADRIFRQAMRDEGVAWVKRTLAWAMVRVFGWIPWPPSRTTVRNVLTRSAHTLWQGGGAAFIAVAAGWPWWTVGPLAAGLSAVKTLVQVTPMGDRVKDTLYR